MSTKNINLSDLNSQTLAQLREVAKELGIKSVTKYKKAELIEKIKENVNQIKEKDTDIKDDNKNIQDSKETDKKQSMKKEEKNTEIDDN